MPPKEHFNKDLIESFMDELAPYQGYILDKSAKIGIYREISGSISDTFRKYSFQVSKETIDFLSQHYYNGLEINGHKSLNSNEFIDKVSLGDIDLSELLLLESLIKDDDVYPMIVSQLKVVDARL